MSREVFESLLVKSLSKRESKEYALKRKVIDEQGRLGDYIKYETKIAWKWYREGMDDRSINQYVLSCTLQNTRVL